MINLNDLFMCYLTEFIMTTYSTLFSNDVETSYYECFSTIGSYKIFIAVS